jgi:hypothetical protein
VKKEVEKKPEGIFHPSAVLSLRVHNETAPDRSPPVFVCGHDSSIAKLANRRTEEEVD